MATEMALWFFTLLCLSVLSESAVSVCPPFHFFNLTQLKCHKCSKCPINQIIRKPCIKDRDTVCGPFSEFNRFHQAPKNGEFDPGFPFLDDTSNKHHEDGGIPSKDNDVSRYYTTTPDSSRGTVVDLTSVSSGERQWRTLAIALIGILCVVSVCLIGFIFLFCYFKHRRTIVEKQVFYDPEMMGSQESYVQLKSHISSRDRLKSNIRVLRELRSDYDSGSDESAPNTLTPSSHLLSRPLPLVLGPILVDDYDADNSGQTISTNKSSDYVYFNRPHSGVGVMPEHV